MDNNNYNNENTNVNVNVNFNESKKVSPYLGINDPNIRAQYEKEFNKPDYGMINSLVVIFICTIAFIFITSNTMFSFTKKDKIDSNEKIEQTYVDENNNNNNTNNNDNINIDNIDLSTLTVIDNTNTLLSDKVIDASYRIDELNYINSSFKVPYVNIKSEDAIKVNNEIKENYKEWAKESAKYLLAYGNTSLDISSIIKTNYEKLLYDNILSVVISYGKRENSIETYQYYSYVFNLSNNSLLLNSNDDIINELKNNNDAETSIDNCGKLLTYQEILSKLNLSYEVIDMKYKEILTSYSGEYGDIQNVNDTINLYNEEVSNNTLKAFIDNDGNLNLISKIYTPLYENGTYRIFKYDGEKFESITSLSQVQNSNIVE